MPAKQRSLLIIGAGYLGHYIAREAFASGWSVVGMRRHPPHDDSMSWLAADVLAAQNLCAALNECGTKFDAVVYCVSASASSVDAYQDAYRRGLENVIATLPKSTRLIFVSSTGVYSEDDGQWVDEFQEVDQAALPVAQRAILQGEAMVMARPDSIILRLSGIYGPGRTRMVAMAKDARDPLFVSEIAYTNRIHVEDGARAVVHCIELDRPARIYCVTDSDPAPQHEIIVWLRRAMDLKSPRVAFIGRDGASVRANQVPGTNKRVRNSLFVSTGFVFKYPTYREGYATLLTSAPKGESHD